LSEDGNDPHQGKTMLRTPALTEEKTPNNVSQDTWQAGRDAALLLAPSTARWIISSLGAPFNSPLDNFFFRRYNFNL